MTGWEGIQEFIMVVETSSFTKAAKRLHVSASHISRQVARLENQLEVKLLARSTRQVRLTEAGTDYYNKVSVLAAGIEEANQSATGTDATLAGLIRVSAAGTFAENNVAPAIARFARENPKISLEIDFNINNVDLIAQGFDFAIRYGVLADSSLISRKLSERPMVCAASPDYLKRYGTPKHPSELKQHSCLTTNTDRWIFSDENSNNTLEIRVSGRWMSTNGNALRYAATEGLGVTYTPHVNLKSALDNGELIPILQGFEDNTRSNWIVYPHRRHLPLRVRRAISYLLEHCKDNEFSASF